ESRENITQSVLVVDNGYSWPGYLISAIEKIKNYFTNKEISVLTPSINRKDILQKDFPNLRFILPSEKLRLKRYQIALQMLGIRKERYDFIVLFSLDITPLIVSLIFFKSRVILYNQWSQWWTLKLKKVSEISKITYVKKKAKLNFKNLLKNIGLFFVSLQRIDKEILKRSILLVDNGQALFKHIYCAIEQINEFLPRAKISLLTLRQMNELEDNFPELEIINPGKCVIRKYRMARQMIRLRRSRYDYILLLSLDITPIIASSLFMDGRVFLYNEWHQWWSLKLKPMRRYLMTIPLFIFNIIIFAYLLISVLWVFFKRSLNVFRFNLFQMRS
ncbi:MAG: hypothetical protein PVI33_06855, partial [Candidatus Omnitrophota bacterium]